MKRSILYPAMLSVILLSCVRTVSAACTTIHDGSITVELVRLQQSGETLHVEFDIVTKNMKVYSTGNIALVPCLISPTRIYEFPSVLFKGKNEYLAYERKLALMSSAESDAVKQPYKVEKSFNKKSNTIQYRYTIPFEPWMKEARLELRYDESGCGRFIKSTKQQVSDYVTLERPFVPHMTFVQPVAEQVKSREKQIETFLDFEVNKTIIRTEYMNNPKELARIRTMIDELRSDEDITINRLDIVGYASPEGTYANNKRLSEGRAIALKNYLAAQYNFPASTYRTTFGGENWDGLRKALPNLDVYNKDEIEYNINNYDGEERKNRIKTMRGGQPYKYLLANVYPSLRVAVCKVEYHIRNYTVEEAKEVIKVRPQGLSLNELYLVANTYPVGSNEFIEVFELAVRMFPEDEVSRLNAAATALTRKDAEKAEYYLNMINDKTRPEYLNAVGVLALLKGDYEAAERDLDKAYAAGLKSAGENLKELKRMKKK